VVREVFMAAALGLACRAGRSEVAQGRAGRAVGTDDSICSGAREWWPWELLQDHLPLDEVTTTLG